MVRRPDGPAPHCPSPAGCFPGRARPPRFRVGAERPARYHTTPREHPPTGPEAPRGGGVFPIATGSGGRPMERRGSLLLVEDEEVLRGLVAQFLRGLGFRLVEAGDGPGGRRPVHRFRAVRPGPGRPEPAGLLGRRGLPADPGPAARPADHHLQRGHPPGARGGPARAGHPPLPDQALSSGGAGRPHRRRDRPEGGPAPCGGRPPASPPRRAERRPIEPRCSSGLCACGPLRERTRIAGHTDPVRGTVTSPRTRRRIPRKTPLWLIPRRRGSGRRPSRAGLITRGQPRGVLGGDPGGQAHRRRDRPPPGPPGGRGRPPDALAGPAGPGGPRRGAADRQVPAARPDRPGGDGPRLPGPGHPAQPQGRA